jgi:porin
MAMLSTDNSVANNTEGLFDFLDNTKRSSVLLGDMWGLRTWLSRHGMVLAIEETSESLGNISGGTKTGSAYDGLTQVLLQMDTQRAFGHYGGLFNLSLLDSHGNNLSADQLSSLQTASGIETTPGARLWELWYDQKFLEEDRMDIKIGQQSLDQEFMVSSNALYFVNTMFGWPMLPSADLPGGGPAYPLSALGVRLSARPVNGTQILAGVFNGTPVDRQGMDPHGVSFPWGGGVLGIVEAQFSYPALGSMVEPGQDADLGWTFRVGAWYDSRSFADQRLDQNGSSLANPMSNGEAAQHTGDYAAYAVLDKLMWRDAKNPNRTLSFFTRVMGTPLADRNLIDASLNAGVLLRAPFVYRTMDSFGVGMGYAHVSSQAAALDQDAILYTGVQQPVRSDERFVEVTYQYQLRPWIQLQPDVQYVSNPGAGVANPYIPSQRIGNEWVMGLRTNISF